MSNRILPMSDLSLTSRMAMVLGGRTTYGYIVSGSPLVDADGQLTTFGQHVDRRPDDMAAITRDALAYARLVGLVDTLRDELYAAIDSSDRPTMPPQPTCTHYQGVCEHMVCPRELAAKHEIQHGMMTDPHFTPAYYQRFGW